MGGEGKEPRPLVKVVEEAHKFLNTGLHLRRFSASSPGSLGSITLP
ncbi:MAG: hypothetical protein Ct9H300mP11_25470 [Chloroflexota bacterium]|nr:MAG: hypothetical protein Ct9H300mP11_25470 [Chloroflexota bacterium]